MAEKGSATTAEHGGKAFSMSRQRAMPHRIHASMHVMEASNCDFAGDLVLREAEGNHLSRRDDPVLLAGDLRNPAVTSWFFAHTANKEEVSEGSPLRERRTLRGSWGNICSSA